MSNRLRAIFLLLTIVAVVLVSAMGTTSAYADDGAPPPEAGETVPPTGEGEAPPVSEEEASVTEPIDQAPADPAEAATEEASVVEEQLPAEAATEEAPAVEEQLPAEAVAETASILEQVPEETTVTVVNAEGEAQPLTSQESADAILTSDPVWCPGRPTYTPTPGLNGCTERFDSFSKLLSYLAAHETEAVYQQEGTIFVELGAYTGGESSVDFNTYNFQSINKQNLSVQGGWNTTTNTVSTIDTEFNIPIVVGTSTNPWIGSLTFNDISISNVSGQTGLTLFSNGNITLHDVEVTNSQAGAVLDAGQTVVISESKFNSNKKFGAQIKTGRGVDITNSTFDGNTATTNDAFGMKIDSLRDVYLGSVSASNNQQFGADINSGGYVWIDDNRVSPSVFSGNVSYSYTCKGKTKTGGYGLKIVSVTGVHLEQVIAEGNVLYGAHVETVDAEIFSSSFSKNGSGSMSNPKGYGLELLTTGGVGVTLEGVHADNNQLFGAHIEGGTNDVTINNSFFDGNKSYKCTCNGTSYYGYGLKVVTSGNITMNTVSASGNNLTGAELKGLNVTIDGGTFSNNSSGSSSNLTGKGLEITSAAVATLQNIAANNNQQFGANIQAAGGVIIATGFFNGHQVYTHSCQGKDTLSGGGYGLQIVTDGPITMFAVEAQNNYLWGAKLNSKDTVFGVSIGDSLFNHNQAGLDITSSGQVSLANSHADSNRLSGATITAGGLVTIGGINGSTFSGNQSYTYSSCKGKTYYGYGLQVHTTGGINLLNVQTLDNYVYGAHLEGTNVNISTSSFSSNGTDAISDHVGKGLEVVSKGADSLVSLFQVTANENQLFGANIQAEGLVLIDNSVFSGNKSYTSTCSCKTYDGYGLRVFTTSNVGLNNVTAEKNYLYGAHLEGANVTVSNSSFNLNASPLQSGKAPTGRGLEVKSSGDVLLQYVQANENQLFGADVQANGKVDVLSSVFAKNIYYTYSSCKGTKSAGYGLKVVAAGPIKIEPEADDPANKGVQAYGNGAEGAILQGQSTVAVSNSDFYNNGASGLVITANGNVTLSQVSATGNAVDGVDVTGVCTNTVRVENGGTYAQNGKYGIKVVNAIYSTDGTQTFANNPSGNVFVSACGSSTSNTASTSSQTNTGYSGGYHHHSHTWYGHYHH